MDISKPETHDFIDWPKIRETPKYKKLMLRALIQKIFDATFGLIYDGSKINDEHHKFLEGLEKSLTSQEKIKEYCQEHGITIDFPATIAEAEKLYPIYTQVEETFRPKRPGEKAN